MRKNKNKKEYNLRLSSVISRIIGSSWWKPGFDIVLCCLKAQIVKVQSYANPLHMTKDIKVSLHGMKSTLYDLHFYYTHHEL